MEIGFVLKDDTQNKKRKNERKEEMKEGRKNISTFVHEITC